MNKKIQFQQNFLFGYAQTNFLIDQANFLLMQQQIQFQLNFLKVYLIKFLFRHGQIFRLTKRTYE